MSLYFIQNGMVLLHSSMSYILHGNLYGYEKTSFCMVHCLCLHEIYTTSLVFLEQLFFQSKLLRKRYEITQT